MSNPKDNPAEIYLVPDTEHGQVWSHDPAPGEGMKKEDATRYVRADLAPAGNDVLAQCISKLTLERNAQEAKRWAIQRAAEALLSAATDAERKEAQRKLNAVVKDEYDYDEVETPRPNYFDYRELQRQHDELQTMFFNERKKSSELQAQVSKQSKVIEHIAAAVGEEADPMACWEAVDALIHKAESLEQEAKIHASELDTQKSIVRDLCNLFGLRVHDYHCVGKVKEAVEGLRAQIDQFRFELTSILDLSDHEVFVTDAWHDKLSGVKTLLTASPAQCLAEVKAQAVRSFVSDTNDTGKISWFASQWLEDWRDEWLSQSAKAGE